MSDITWSNDSVRLGDLKPWERNPRRMTKRAAQRLLDSWRDYGQVHLIVVGPDNEVYDGHQRLSALKALYGEDYEVEVRRASRALSEDERKRLVVLLHTGAAGGWDWDTLSAWDANQLISWGMDEETLSDWKRDIKKLSQALKRVEPGELPDVEPKHGIADQLLKKWDVKPGQLWILGNHRLLCGDSTSLSDVSRILGDDKIEMVFTDPPYGVSIGAKNRLLDKIDKSGKALKDIHGDDLDEEALRELLRHSFDNAIKYCNLGASWYVAAPFNPLNVLFGQVLKERGILRQTICYIKNKPTFALLGVCYHWQVEAIFFGWLPNGSRRWYGGRTETNAWNIKRPDKSPEHPTIKPVELVARAVKNSSREGDVVYDPFVGSGTTIIACENLNRKCLAIEIEPSYVAVCLERWASLTGKSPQLLA